MKIADGCNSRSLSFYCAQLHVSRQAFYKYRQAQNKPWKYDALAQEIREIISEDICNDTYGRIRIHEALKLRHEGEAIASTSTIYRVMKQIGLTQHIKRKPNGITKSDRNARKSDDLLQRDFRSDKPFCKCITDITEIKVAGGKLYVSALFDCYNLGLLGLAMDTNMKASLCVQTLADAKRKFPQIRGAVLHSDRGSQYTSNEYREALSRHGIIQSMNSDGGRCHDNARCESMWARMKEELLYGRYNTEKMSVDEVKAIIWRYYVSYWNNRRICSANGGLPPMQMLKKYYEEHENVA